MSTKARLNSARKKSSSSATILKVGAATTGDNDLTVRLNAYTSNNPRLIQFALKLNF